MGSPTQLQTCAFELNLYGKLCRHFHQYLAFVRSLPRTLEGHRAEDVTSKVSDPSFTNLVQRSDRDEESMLISWLFGGKNLILNKELRPYEGGDLSCPVGLVESECPLYFDLEKRHCSQKRKGESRSTVLDVEQRVTYFWSEDWIVWEIISM